MIKKFFCSKILTKKIDKVKKDILHHKYQPPHKIDFLYKINSGLKTTNDFPISNNIERKRLLLQVSKELNENPYLIEKIIDDTISKDLSKEEEEIERKRIKKDILENLEKYPKRNTGFFTSLLNKHRTGYDIRSEEQKIKNNFEFFEHAIGLQKPRQLLNKIELHKIHSFIDLKMDELEETGMSKEEILYGVKNCGLPLKQDSFFQFIKNNHSAREMLIQPTEIFSVETVIEKAL